MASEKTFTLASGQSITMRAPTEIEVLAYLDRRADIEAGIRPSMDANDDGDKQLEVCVTAPAANALMELLDEFPLLTRYLREGFYELAGYLPTFRRADHLIDPAYRRAGQRLIGFLYDEPDGPVKPIPLMQEPGETAEAFDARRNAQDDAWAAAEAAHEAILRQQLIVLTKLSRFEVKALEHEARQTGRTRPLPGATARLARLHVVTLQDRAGHKQEILDRLAAAPFLLVFLSNGLTNAAQVQLKEEQGKS